MTHTVFTSSVFRIRFIVIAMVYAAVCATGLSLKAESGSGTPAATHRFEIGDESFLLDGNPIQIRCGEIHYARVPREYWKHRIEMVRASGMNAVCVYLFWNFHERVEGEFTWEGQADVVEFCRLAQEAGLWVVLRPGPYSCAEWEMGGLPWWLLKHEDIALRSRDPRFIDAVRRYFKEVGKELGDLQVSRGGPILMVQVENEYGFYSDDVQYMGEVKNALLDAGFDVPLFACNPPQYITEGFDPDLFQVVNFGSDPEGAFAALREVQPKGPLMCGEFYPAWFDTWGNPHHDGDPGDYIPTLDRMTEMGASYSIYMVHGGTSFGFWSGADRPFKPDTSSYDYDAPVSEAGWSTDGFYALREMVERHLKEGETLPPVPPENPVIEISPITFEKTAGIFENLPEPVRSDSPKTFEKLDTYRGGMVYRTTLGKGSAGVLSAEAINDFAWVYLDGELLGVTDRRSRSFQVAVPERKKDGVLEFFVWSMGRINFGPEMHDRKGIHGPVSFSDAKGVSTELRGWEHFPLTMDADYRDHLNFMDEDSSSGKKQPAFWKATFDLDEVGDTFLDMSSWGKGMVWVNGHALGRFWNIGPTQTMYLPGPWLTRGANEIVIFDILGSETSSVSGLKQPVLDWLRPELDFSGPRRRLSEPNLAGATPVLSDSFNASSRMETLLFKGPAKGRYVTLKSLNSHEGKLTASVGELDFLDDEGALIPHTKWTIAYVSSEERHDMDGTAENAIDGQTASIWSSYFAHNTPDHPHLIVVDLGESRTVTGIRYVPGSGEGERGLIRDFEIYVGDDLVTFPVHENGSDPHEPVFLFSYFLDNGQDGLHLAWSKDGVNWDALNHGESFLHPEVGEDKLMRDPCVVKGPDGTFHMVWTDSWHSKTIGYASTRDFIHWSDQKEIPVMIDEPTATNCWAPEIVYDAKTEQFVIFWATTLPEKFTETWYDGKNHNNHRIYFTTTKDFEDFSPTRLFFDPGFNCIDSTLLQRDGRSYMFFKDESVMPSPMKNLRLAVADDIMGPYRTLPINITDENSWVEGPTAIEIGEYVYLYFDAYAAHHYACMCSKDLENWEDLTDRIRMPEGIRHGTAFPVEASVLQVLQNTKPKSFK